MPADYEHPLSGVLQKISSQLDDVVERLESIEQLARAQTSATEEFDQARTRITREGQQASSEQEHAVDAVRRTLSQERDRVGE